MAGLGEGDISDEVLDDWRMGEFSQLLAKENNLRRSLYKWWLKVRVRVGVRVRVRVEVRVRVGVGVGVRVRVGTSSSQT